MATSPPQLPFLARLAIYFFVVLFALQAPLGMVLVFPIVGPVLHRLVLAVWNPVVVAVGGVLGQAPAVFPNPSGDTTWNYIQLLVAVVLSLGLGLSLARSRTRDARRVRAWAIVVLRYLIAFTMISYGLAKVFPLQFGGGIDLMSLLQTYGDSSPMGLMWRFMGYSVAYTVFTGSLEVIAGVLLFSRQTSTLGALLTMAVMGNVVVLNFSYDVCVKLFSTTMVVMTIFVLSPECSRLWNFFVAGRAVPAPTREPTLPPWLARIRRPSRWAIVVFVTFMAWVNHERTSIYQPGPLDGVYRVDSFLLDGDERPPLLDDKVRWRAMTIENNLYMGIQQMDGSLRGTRFYHDPEARTLTGRFAGTDADKVTWHYEQPEPTRMILQGQMPGGEVEIVLEQRDISDFELTGRGFHWVNEFPHNR